MMRGKTVRLSPQHADGSCSGRPRHSGAQLSTWGPAVPPLGFNTFKHVASHQPPLCSYCHLETTFSVYVYGALPLSIIPKTVTVIPLIMAILLSVWLAHMVPKLLHTKKGLRLKEFWVSLCRRCRRLCTFSRGRR